MPYALLLECYGQRRNADLRLEKGKAGMQGDMDGSGRGASADDLGLLPVQARTKEV